MRANDTQTDYKGLSKEDDPGVDDLILDRLAPSGANPVALGSRVLRLTLVCAIYLSLLEVLSRVRLPNVFGLLDPDSPAKLPDLLVNLCSPIIGFLGLLWRALGKAFFEVIMVVSNLVDMMPLPTFVSAFSVTLLLTAFLSTLVSLPLKRADFKQAYAMARIQQEMRRLQEQYGHDRSQLAVKQYELYRRHGVNPAKGCIPGIALVVLLSGLWSGIQSIVARSVLLDTHFMWISSLALCEPNRNCDAAKSVFFYPIPLLILAYIVVTWDFKKRRWAPDMENKMSPESARHIANFFTLVFAITLSKMPAAIVFYLVSRYVMELAAKRVYSRT